MVGTIRIGIDGWTYKPWHGTFHPADLVQKRELEFAYPRADLYRDQRHVLFGLQARQLAQMTRRALYMDIALANAYEPVAMFLMDWQMHRVEPLSDRCAILAMIKTSGDTSHSANLLVALCKPAEEPPVHDAVQGYYADTLPPEERAVCEADAS